MMHRASRPVTSVTFLVVRPTRRSMAATKKRYETR